MYTRARAYRPQPVVVSSREIEDGKKKNPRTLTYISYILRFAAKHKVFDTL